MYFLKFVLVLSNLAFGFPEIKNMDFLDRKPGLKKVLETPFAWQEFLENNSLRKNPDNRTVE